MANWRTVRRVLGVVFGGSAVAFISGLLKLPAWVGGRDLARGARAARRTTLSVGVTRFTTMSEWAQLLAGPPSPHAALERGHWYRVEAPTKDGIVPVMGPNAIGRPVAESLVRIINHEHRIYPLRIGDSNVECRLCARTYELENEQHV